MNKQLQGSGKIQDTTTRHIFVYYRVSLGQGLDKAKTIARKTKGKMKLTGLPKGKTHTKGTIKKMQPITPRIITISFSIILSC